MPTSRTWAHDPVTRIGAPIDSPDVTIFIEEPSLSVFSLQRSKAPGKSGKYRLNDLMPWSEPPIHNDRCTAKSESGSLSNQYQGAHFSSSE
jgi:hypothetical protein